jgi:hypothetical protein
LVAVLQSAEATFDERIKAAGLLTKLLGLAPQRKAGGRQAEKKSKPDSRDCIADLVSAD